MKKLYAGILVLLAAVFAFASGSKEQSSAEGKTYVFASDATYPPFEYVDEAGNLDGFEVKLIPAIGEHVGVKMTVKNVPWDTIFAGLQNGAYDGIASGVTITEERKQSMDFSTPIVNDGQILVVVAGRNTIKGPEDIDSSVKIGCQIGTTGDFAAEELGADVRRYDDIGLAIEDMLNGNLDACVCDSVVASDFILANENYKGKLATAGEPLTQDGIAICVRKGDKELLDLVNKGLEAMEKDGSLAALKKQYNLL